MSSTEKNRPGIASIIGYIIWFALLVRLLYLATSDGSSGFAESLGVHLGIALSLLALLGIPYFIVRHRAKRRGEQISWFIVMMWTTIIALLLCIGGFYGKSQVRSAATAPAQETGISATTTTQPQPAQAIDPRDALLQMHVEQLSDEQYNAAINRWLEMHPEASSQESKNVMSQLLQEVYNQYPRSALGPALDMALRRGQRATSEPAQSAQQVATQKFQCNGSYTKRIPGTPEEFTLSGVAVEVGDTFVVVQGAAVFDGNFKIINHLDNGVGFESPRDETLSGFFNRFSGELSLIDRLGPKNADGSFQVSANSSLICKTANAMF